MKGINPSQKNAVFSIRFFRQDPLNFASFPFSFWARVCLASVGVDDVRDVINASSAEVPDAKVLKMIKRAVEGKVKITEKNSTCLSW